MKKMPDSITDGPQFEDDIDEAIIDIAGGISTEPWMPDAEDILAQEKLDYRRAPPDDHDEYGRRLDDLAFDDFLHELGYPLVDGMGKVEFGRLCFAKGISRGITLAQELYETSKKD